MHTPLTAGFWMVFAVGCAFMAVGGYHLFQAKAQRDRALGIYEGRRGWLWSLGRTVLQSSGYVLSLRIGGAAAILVGGAMVCWGAWRLTH